MADKKPIREGYQPREKGYQPTPTKPLSGGYQPPKDEAKPINPPPKKP